MKEVEIQKEAFADAQAQEHDKIVKKALQMGMTIKEYEEWLSVDQYQAALKTEVETLEEREDVTDAQESVDKRAVFKYGSKDRCQKRQSETLPFEKYQAWILKSAKENNMTLEAYEAYLHGQADKLKLSLEEYIARLMCAEFAKVSSLETSDNWDYSDPAEIRGHIEEVRHSAPVSVDDDKDNDTDNDELMKVIAKEVNSNFDLQQSHLAKSYISVSTFFIK